MMSLIETQKKIESDPGNWSIYLMDFVDDFRYYRKPSLIQQPLENINDPWTALLTSTVQQLCHELGIPSPPWVERVPAVASPWFVSNMNSLKAIALVESPLAFRLRKIFVLENFLNRI